MIEITVKSGAEVEAISIDDEAAQLLIGATGTDAVHLVKAWIRNEIVKAAVVKHTQLREAYIAAHVSESS